jgi:CBS domain-containing protein
MVKVREVMSTDLEVIGPDASYKDAVAAMLHRGVSGLPVVDRQNVLVGIVTEADLIRRQGFAHQHRHRALSLLGHLLAGADPYIVRRTEGLTVADVMTQPVVRASPDDDVRAVARLMVRRGVKRLPVVEDGHVVGLVARPDLLRLFDRPDAELAASVTATLADPLVGPEHQQIAVDVRDGVVSLSGSVLHPSDISVATAIAGAMPGVIDVTTSLSAREPEPGLDNLDIRLR